MEDEMELIELWIKEVRGFDEMRALYNDLLSVQKSMEIEERLALVVITSGCSGNPLATCKLLSALVKVYQLLHAIFENTGQSLFKFCIIV